MDNIGTSEFTKKDSLLPMLQEVFGEQTDTLLSLVLYKMQGGGAMRNAETCYDGNAANIFFPHAVMASQGISDFLSALGKESLQSIYLDKIDIHVIDLLLVKFLEKHYSLTEY